MFRVDTEGHVGASINGRGENHGAEVHPAMDFTLSRIIVNAEKINEVCPDFVGALYDDDGQPRCHKAFPVGIAGELAGSLVVNGRKFSDVRFRKLSARPLKEARARVRVQCSLHPQDGDWDHVSKLLKREVELTIEANPVTGEESQQELGE